MDRPALLVPFWDLHESSTEAIPSNPPQPPYIFSFCYSPSRRNSLLHGLWDKSSCCDNTQQLTKVTDCKNLEHPVQRADPMHTYPHRPRGGIWSRGWSAAGHMGWGACRRLLCSPALSPPLRVVFFHCTPHCRHSLTPHGAS